MYSIPTSIEDTGFQIRLAWKVRRPPMLVAPRAPPSECRLAQDRRRRRRRRRPAKRAVGPRRAVIGRQGEVAVLVQVIAKRLTEGDVGGEVVLHPAEPARL